MSMVERVAQSIAERRGIAPEQRSDGMMAVFRMDARAAVEAMRDPTRGMIAAADDEDSDKYVARGRAISSWQAMIDAALAE